MKITGVHVLVAILLFFGAIIAINVAFAVAAVQTFPGEEERRSYTQGLHYNEVLAERRAQRELGWHVSSELTAGTDGAQIIVALRDRRNQPVNYADISATLRWAPGESGDRPLTFEPQGDGVYIARIGALDPGRWKLRAHAQKRSGEALDFEAELTWPPRH